MTTDRQDKEFIANVISRTLLEDAIEWIKSNMTPEDVFDSSELSDWAESNGYVKDDDD
jgi:hypothetical protein